MKIPLDEKTRISSDSHNFTIEKMVGKDKEGQDKWVAKRFYTTIGGLLNGLYQQKLRSSDCTTLSGLVVAVKTSNRWLASIAKELDAEQGLTQ